MASKVTCTVLTVLSGIVSMIAFSSGFLLFFRKYLLPSEYNVSLILFMLALIISKNWIFLYGYGCDGCLVDLLFDYDFSISMLSLLIVLVIGLAGPFDNKITTIISAVYIIIALLSAILAFGALESRNKF